MNIFSFIMLIGGLTFFLFGMNVMSGSLEKMAGGKLEHLLKKMTANPLLSLGLGAVITIAVQSSSAVTVMLVGLVNSGIMQFSQTLNVIFGANIGTTLTSWILSLSGIQSDSVWINLLKPENFSPIIALIGILMAMLSKNDQRKSIGTVFVGFAVLIYGMKMMTDAVSPLADSPEFALLLTKFNQPLIGVAVGLIFTGIIQSSAASIGVLQALSLTGSISYGMAIPIIMGQNIGTCVTSLISCIGTNTQAKRVAIVHTMINVIGTVVWLPVVYIMKFAVHLSILNTAVSPVTIALIHTMFNISATLLLMPFGKQLLRLTEWLAKGVQQGAEQIEVVPFLDERLLLSPSVAIRECNNATGKMMELSRENLFLANSLFDQYNEKKAALVLQTEDEIDAFEDRLGTYLVKLSAQALSQGDSQVISKMLHVIGDFERLGDHAVNLAKVAKEIYDKGVSFTEEANRELGILARAIDEILTITVNAYEKNDIEIASKVEPLEQVIDQLTAQMKSNHIARLQRGICTIEMGFIFSDLLSNYERISDHCSNIAVAVIEVIHNSFDTHKYLHGVRYGNNEFNSIYDGYQEKYSL